MMKFDDFYPWRPTPWWRRALLGKPKWFRKIWSPGGHSFPYSADYTSIQYHGPFPDEIAARTPYRPPLD